MSSRVMCCRTLPWERRLLMQGYVPRLKEKYIMGLIRQIEMPSRHMLVIHTKNLAQKLKYGMRKKTVQNQK